MSSEFWFGVAMPFLVVMALFVLYVAFEALHLAVDWLTSQIHRYRMMRTVYADTSIGLTDEEKRGRYERFVDILAHAPKFRLLSVLGWSIVICRDYKENTKDYKENTKDYKENTKQ